MSGRVRPAIIRNLSIVLLSLLLGGCASGGGGGSDEADSGGIAVGSGDSAQNPGPIPTDSGPVPSGAPGAAEDPGGGAAPGSAPNASPSSGTLRVTTFNTGLLPGFVPFAQDRVPALQTALAAHDAEVLCLQEVWLPEHANQLRAIAPSFPFIHVPQARQKLSDQDPVCEPQEVEPLFSCLISECLFDEGEFTQCALESCYADAAALAESNPDCAGTIFAQAGQAAAAVLEIQAALFGSDGAELFSFGGSSGLMLASKHELRDIRELDFFDVSTTSRRVAIFATVNVRGQDHVISCTHLASNLEGLVPYTGSSGSWLGEAREQARRLAAFAAEYAGERPQLLAGDLNCSLPSGRGVEGDFEPVCQDLLGRGYQDPAGGELGCSFCLDNLLNVMNDGLRPQRNLLLDHVLVQNVARVTGVSRVLDQTIKIGSVESTLSDHYGVRLTVAP